MTQQRDITARKLIKAIRDERQRRRLTVIASESGDHRHIWDPTQMGPYAVFDKQSGTLAIDVLGLAHELGYLPQRPGAETKLLKEVEDHTRRTASNTRMSATQYTLRMYVALAHRIITSLVASGDLGKMLDRR